MYYQFYAPKRLLTYLELWTVQFLNFYLLNLDTSYFEIRHDCDQMASSKESKLLNITAENHMTLEN